MIISRRKGNVNWIAQMRELFGCLIFTLALLAGMAGQAAEVNLSPLSPTLNLADPGLMTGTLYEIGSNRKKVIFKFSRAATNDNGMVQVEQLFTLPDGTVACREHIIYRNNQLVSYKTEDLRADTVGSIIIDHNSKKPKVERLVIEHIQGHGSAAKTAGDTESLESNTLICDTIYPFILTHWDELAQGTAVKFHFVSLEPPGTFSFRVIKEAEAEWEGHPVIRIKMEPTNFIISHLIRPIYFMMEKAAPHRVFSYTGRTTPRSKVGEAWKFIEAEVVFDWK